MRPKIVAVVIGFAVIALIGLSLLRSRRDQPGDPDGGNAAVNAKALGTTPETSAHLEKSNSTSGLKTAGSAILSNGVAASRLANATTAGPVAKSSEPLTHEEYVEQRVGELMDLGMTDDPEALKTLLTEIHNSDPEIRKAAVEATKQFGSADAIPKLEEAIATAETAEDKQDLKEAIEFLKLPSILAKHY
jgi:hypothetical protein